MIKMLRYCQSRQCDADGAYCGGCSLRNNKDGIFSMDDFINRFDEVKFTESDRTIKGSGKGIYYVEGCPKDLGQHWQGQNGWVIAEKLLDGQA